MATLTEQPAPEGGAGWYPDPIGSGEKLRYFDGSAWTQHVRAIDKAASGNGKARKKGGFPRPHWRKMTWVIVIWCVVMAIWMIAAIANAGSAADSNCVHHAYLTHKECVDVSNAGTGIGVVALWFVWFFGFIVLSLIWFMSRPRGRTCPACGEKVKKGRTNCPECNHDFAAAAMSAPPPASA